jgi:beta-mannosidase
MVRFDLGGTHWQVCQSGETEGLPATVPGCVHLDLLEAGQIPNPFVRDNELEVQWIGQTDWTYCRDFDVDSALLSCRRVLLRCEGLDTLATVRLNGKRVSETDNMFRMYEFDVKRFLRPGRNRIEITFASTYPYTRKQQARRHLYNSFPERRNAAPPTWVRKEPCNYGWDWGPILVTCGIWRPIQLIGIGEGRLADVSIRQRHSKKNVALDVRVEAEQADNASCRAQVAVSFGGEPVASAELPVSQGAAGTTLRIGDPRLWWPNGLGEQPLYTVTVKLVDSTGQIIDTTTRTIGLRTIKLVRKRDKWGESFCFEVNGVPFFAKGANWIPADAFAPRLTALDYDWLVGSAAAANMNMLRVWGGGIYESDAFYNLCDQYGILVWQDFMFACATYPTFDAEFMANVRAEAVDNVRRLRHHPSIALWCGNNEIEMCLVGPKWTGHQMSWEDYGKLFDKMLPEVCAELDPDNPYWPASPHTPVGDRSKSDDPASGDAHLWNVWHGREPFEWFRTSTHRFCSEFGFQSFPEPRTIATFTNPDERNVTHRVMEHHQRSWIGNSAIVQYMLSWFRMPRDFDSLVWLSQIEQGMAMQYGVEHWRRNRPRSMGALYWQLNDCWPVVSWASIDYFGRWKALQYMAKRFFAPLLVSLLEDKEKRTVEVHVTDDRVLTARQKAMLEWTITDLDGNEIAAKRESLRLGPGISHLVRKVDVARLSKGTSAYDLLFWAKVRSGDGADAVESANLVTFVPPKHLSLRKPEIRLQIAKALTDDSFEVYVECRFPALFVRLEIAGADAQFSDNFFHLRPGHPVTVTVTPHTQMNMQTLRASLRAQSLVDTYE